MRPSADTRGLNPGAYSPEEAGAKLAKLRAAQPETFKMVHQVAAHYQTQTYLMTGYLLGRRDGQFLLSALAAVGPRLFDVAKVNGQWESKMHLKQLGERLDPRHVGRAVERIYFLTAEGPLVWEAGAWVSRAPVLGEEDVDAVEVFRAPETLATVRKRFSRAGVPVLDILYDKLESRGGQLVAGHVKLVDARGFTLELALTDYVPDFPVPQTRLQLAPQS